MIVPGVVPGLLSAVCWGTSDFGARFVSRRSGVLRGMFYAQAVAAIVLTLGLPWLHGAGHARPGLWLLLIGANLAVLAGTGLLYQGLAVGRVAVVAPLMASYGAISAALALATGHEHASIRLAFGLALVCLGAALTATPARRTPGRGGAIFGLGAALCFGVGFWAQGVFAVPVLGPYLPAWSYYAFGVPTIALAARLRGTPLPRPSRAEAPPMVLVSLLAMGGALTLTLGAAEGAVAVSVALSSLASAVTVIMARIWLREPVAWTGWLGLAAIIAGLLAVRLG